MIYAVALLALLVAYLWRSNTALRRDRTQQAVDLNFVIRTVTEQNTRLRRMVTEQNTRLRGRLRQYAVPFDDIAGVDGPDPRFRPKPWPRKPDEGADIRCPARYTPPSRNLDDPQEGQQ